ncbi:MAG: CPBP family intramembrane metalloprotease [Bacteroidetes bacterium]|nr:CPBP family intramembrane metalloprotease [Bacteroidota bacterium]
MQSQLDTKHRVQYSSRFLVLLGVFILSNFMIFPLLGFVLVTRMYDVTFEDIPLIVSNPSHYDYGIQVMLWLQVISSFGGFFVTAFIFLKSYRYRVFDYLGLSNNPNLKALLLCLLIIFSNIAVVNLLGALNYRIPIPDIGGFKELTESMNQKMSSLTDSLLVMNNIWDLMIRLFVMALLPAFVEEVFFRGLLQRYVSEWFGSAVAGIIVSALVFSLFHFKFEQIIPIFYVGLLFGYIYFRTRNLAYTILMHFVHNGFIVALTYYVGGTEAKEFMKDDYVPGVAWVLPSLLGLGIGIFFLMKMFPKQLIEVEEQNEAGGEDE